MTMLTLGLAAYFAVGFGLALHDAYADQEWGDRVSVLMFVMNVLFGCLVLVAALPVILTHAVPYLVGRFCGYVARRFAEGYAAGNAR